MTRWSFFLLFCLGLSGCSQPKLTTTNVVDSKRAVNLATTDEVRLFAQGLAEYFASGKLMMLQSLPQKYPHGEWRGKAEDFLALVKKHRAQQARLKKMEKELSEHKKEKAALVQDKQKLEGTLKRLKEALIDSELRPK